MGKNVLLLAALAAALTTGLAAWRSVQAHGEAPLREVVAPNTNVSVEIIIEGSPAVVYRDGAYRWVEGRRGERFAFRITNRNPFPVGVIPSADGHSLTANGRARADHPAYVLGPYESQAISIWREDLGGGRELMFTDVDRSLAARKGDRRNIGVLGVLVWQLEDRTPPPVPMTRDRASAEKATPEGGRSHDGIGVGYGDRVTDRAYMTDRYRRVRVLGTIAIYYDDRHGLERAGVDLNQYWYRYAERHTPDRRHADPFPDGDYRGVQIP